MAASAPSPLVISERVYLAELIQRILEQSAESGILIICSTQDAFVRQLHCSRAHPSGEAEERLAEQEVSGHAMSRWATPTLRLLALSRRIKLVFCPDVVHLRAYLATYSIRGPSERSETLSGGCPPMVLVNPINLHRPTSAFSAQGLNRTFAGAVEAAARSRSRLVLAECISEADHELPHEPYEDEANFNRAMASDTGPWDEEVSILNVTTKTFGAGERGWVGRTVKIRAIAERWCHFGSFSSEH